MSYLEKILAILKSILEELREKKPIEELPEIMLIEDVAKYMRVSKQTVYRYVAMKDGIPHRKKNKHSLYFLRDEIHKWVKEKK